MNTAARAMRHGAGMFRRGDPGPSTGRQPAPVTIDPSRRPVSRAACRRSCPPRFAVLPRCRPRSTTRPRVTVPGPAIRRRRSARRASPSRREGRRTPRGRRAQGRRGAPPRGRSAASPSSHRRARRGRAVRRARPPVSSGACRAARTPTGRRRARRQGGVEGPRRGSGRRSLGLRDRWCAPGARPGQCRPVPAVRHPTCPRRIPPAFPWFGLSPPARPGWMDRSSPRGFPLKHGPPPGRHPNGCL